LTPLKRNTHTVRQTVAPVDNQILKLQLAFVLTLLLVGWG